MEITFAHILAIVAGVTQFIKTKMNLVDTAAELLSAAVGILCGSAYQYSVTKPVDFSGWLVVVVVGLITWLTTAGLYKLVFSNKQ